MAAMRIMTTSMRLVRICSQRPKLLPQLKLILAGRADDHNHLNDLVLSPRAALAFQPNDDHNLRLTYNRAFSTPGYLQPIP